MSATLKATINELEAAGIPYSVQHGRRHYQVRFTVGGTPCLVTCSRTTSDGRAALNARLQVRRTIRHALKI